LGNYVFNQLSSLFEILDENLLSIGVVFGISQAQYNSRYSVAVVMVSITSASSFLTKAFYVLFPAFDS